MWLVCAILTFIIWGTADLFYKKSNLEQEDDSHLKTSIVVGIVMGIHAIIYYFVNHVSISFMDIIKYLPVSLCYMISMIIGYKGLRYIDLSISSPIQNTSGFITSILLCIIFKEVLSISQLMGLLCMFLGVVIITIVELRKDNTKKKILSHFKIWIILFPIIYSVIDGLGTFLDAIYLDKLKLISEDAALVSYELTFFIYALIMTIYLVVVKKSSIKFLLDKNKLCASIFETIGQWVYVYAIVSHSEISIPIVSCYSFFSIFLSHIVLKEKLNIYEKVGILIIFIGIIILSIM